MSIWSSQALSRNEDLFWGLRGAGANLGIVTSFKYRLRPVGPVLGGHVGLFAGLEAGRCFCSSTTFRAIVPTRSARRHFYSPPRPEIQRSRSPFVIAGRRVETR